MSNKIPCGGFYLDDMLNVNESGELSINGGTPYQQLVTDGDGNTQWEDRLAYEGDSRLVIDLGDGVRFVKVADEVPSWATIDAPLKAWISTKNDAIIPEVNGDIGNGSFSVGEYVFFIVTDNFKFNGHVFPEKGVYFVSGGDIYTTGVASADSDTPEITWDGNIGTIKTIDPKYIPSELNEVILPSSTSGSSKKFKITVDDSGAISATEVTT